MEPIRLDELSPDLQEALRKRAEAEGKTAAEYVLDLIRRDLDVTSWPAWLDELSQDPPVTDADIARAVAEGRAERDAALFDAVTTPGE